MARLLAAYPDIQQCYWDAPFSAYRTAHAIPFLPGHVWGDATAVSRTGIYIGGASWKVIYNSQGQVAPQGQAAFIWDAAHGTRNLKDVLAAEGADLTGWNRLCDDLRGTGEHGDGFFDITGISEDGRWITGTGAKSGVRHAYVAYLNEAPSVSAVSPATAPNTAEAHVSISGLCFRDGAAVKLSRGGQPDIPGTSVTVSSLSSLTCAFDLTGKAAGQWDVVVTNTDGLSGTLLKGLAVVLPASAKSLGAAVRSVQDPVMADASSRYRFRFWGRATVVGPSAIRLDDGSTNTIEVLAPGHAGIAGGDYAYAVGTLVLAPEGPVLLSSSDQVRQLD